MIGGQSDTTTTVAASRLNTGWYAPSTGPLTILVESHDDVRVVRIAGELDFSGCEFVTRCCIEDLERDVVVELADLTFLDCGGYRAFVAARTALQQQSRTLTLVGAVDEPGYLLALIQQLEGTELASRASNGPPFDAATKHSLTTALLQTSSV